MKENIPLAQLTTFNVGGKARYFVEVTTIEEIIDALAFARRNALPVFVLGGGSNIVIADSGFDGLVISMHIRGITSEKKEGETLVSVGSGVVWDEFVVLTIEDGLKGLECMFGVPGTVGGAVVANLGCYGAQCSDTFVNAEVIDMKSGSSKSQVIKKEACDFSYHDSLFGKNSGRYIVLNATFALSTDSATTQSYKDNRFDMAELAKSLGHEPTQKDVRDAVLAMREEKGNLIMKGRFSYKCAGSFFHMPFVSPEKYSDVVARAQNIDVEKEKNLRPWAWEQKNGSYKIAPGFLLEYTEFQKGFVRGAVGISPRHTLSIINVMNASAKDIAGLAHDMQSEVKKIFGIDLEREVEYVGDVEK